MKWTKEGGQTIETNDDSFTKEDGENLGWTLIGESESSPDPKTKYGDEDSEGDSDETIDSDAEPEGQPA